MKKINCYGQKKLTEMLCEHFDIDMSTVNHAYYKESIDDALEEFDCSFSTAESLTLFLDNTNENSVRVVAEGDGVIRFAQYDNCCECMAYNSFRNEEEFATGHTEALGEALMRSVLVYVLKRFFAKNLCISDLDHFVYNRIDEREFMFYGRYTAIYCANNTHIVINESNLDACYVIIHDGLDSLTLPGFDKKFKVVLKK